MQVGDIESIDAGSLRHQTSCERRLKVYFDTVTVCTDLKAMLLPPAQNRKDLGHQDVAVVEGGA